MDFIRKGADTLRAAEKELRSLAGEGAKAGDWKAVTAVARWAQTLADLVAAEAGPADGAPQPHKETPQSHPEVVKATVASRGRASGRRKERGSYPRFFKDGDALVKVGWSKKSKAEYEHRCSRANLELTVSRLESRGQGGALFTVEELMPVTGRDGEVPGYQVYLCLAWMRANGLLEAHGRRGYSLRSPGELAAATADAWRNMTGKAKNSG